MKLMEQQIHFYHLIGGSSYKLTIDTVVPIVRMTYLGSQRECPCANCHFIPCRLSYF